MQFMDCSSGCRKKPRAGLYAGNAAPSLCNCLLFFFFFYAARKLRYKNIHIKITLSLRLNSRLSRAFCAALPVGPALPPRARTHVPLHDTRGRGFLRPADPPRGKRWFNFYYNLKEETGEASRP